MGGSGWLLLSSLRCNSIFQNKNFFWYSFLTQHLTLIWNFYKQPQQNLYSLQNKSDYEVLTDSHSKNFQQFNQAESKTWYFFCSEPVNNRVRSSVSKVQRPTYRFLRPESRFRRLEHSKLATRAKEFWCANFIYICSLKRRLHGFPKS